MTRQPALILIVDDDYDFLEINRVILERAGYRVITAAEPAQAFRLMEEEAPDLVITDLMMTSVDAGFAFSKALRADPRFAGIPIVMSTSVASALGLDFRPRTEEDLAAMHVDAFLDKPLRRESLLRTVRSLLGSGGDETSSAQAADTSAATDAGAAADADAGAADADSHAPEEE